MSDRKRPSDRIKAEIVEAERQRHRRAQDAAEAIFRGEIQAPMRCGHCRAPSIRIDDDDDARRDEDTKAYLDYRCFACGKRTPVEDVHRDRKQEIQMIIKAGIDPRANRRGS